MTIFITIVIIFLILMFSVQWIWLNGYFKKKRAVQQAVKGNYLDYYIGRGGTGFVGLCKDKLIIFKDIDRSKTIQFKYLYVYQMKNRFDFKDDNSPLTMNDKTYGIILSRTDRVKFEENIKKYKINKIKF